MRRCVIRDLGHLGYLEALGIQHEIEAERKKGLGEDHLLFVEHPHVVTVGRNGQEDNILATTAFLEQQGIELHETDRGGDVTYHGPGQVVGYPVIDLRNWKRDVGAYVRGIEQAVIDTLEEFGIQARRIAGLTGVWTGEGEDAAKIAAIGVHLSRWISTHGWALNVATDLSYFGYIVPCGLTRPVTSMEKLGVRAGMDEVKEALARHFVRVFEFEASHVEAGELVK
jgi:lipoyl(octanoyl) transferase